MGTTGITAYAVWNKATYQITYTFTDGSHTITGVTNNNPTTYNIDDAFALTDPSKDGYEFIEWVGNNEITAESTGNKSFTGKFKDNRPAPAPVNPDPAPYNPVRPTPTPTATPTQTPEPTVEPTDGKKYTLITSLENVKGEYEDKKETKYADTKEDKFIYKNFKVPSGYHIVPEKSKFEVDFATEKEPTAHLVFERNYYKLTYNANTKQTYIKKDNIGKVGHKGNSGHQETSESEES